MSEAFPYSEAKVCAETGVSRTDMKFLRDRNLRVDSDWKKVGGEIALSRAGLKRLWRALETRPVSFDLRRCLISSSHKKNAAITDGAQTNGHSPILLGDTFVPIPTVVTTIAICPNPAVVLAQDEHRSRLMVYVGKNSNFAVGMKLKVAPKIDMPGYWRLVGAPPQRHYSADEWHRRQRAGLQG